MQITTFGIFWLLILLIACVRGKNTLIKCVIFSALFQAGAVFIIAGKAIAPLTVSCIFFIGYSLIVGKVEMKIAIPQFFRAFVIFLFIILISSIVASVAFNGLVYMEPKDWISYAQYDGHIAFFGMFTLLVYGMTLLLIYNTKGIKWSEIDKIFDIMVIFVLAVGVWHYCTVLNYFPRNDFIRDFIYSNSTTKDNIAYFVDTDSLLRIYSSIFGIRFCGPFMEPSYCAGFLAMTFAYYVSKEEIKIKDVILMVFILVMAVMTYSATAYASVAFAGVFSAISSGRTKQLFKIVIRGLALIVVALIMINYFNLWDAIQRLIINKSNTHSAYIRGLWNVSAMGTMFDTFGSGMGYANVRGSSLLFTLPASCGVLGCIAFIWFSYCVYKTGKRLVRIDFSQTKFQIMFLTTMFSMSVAISVLDYSILWMSCIFVVLKKVYDTDK